jgi:hypothetical protein
MSGRYYLSLMYNRLRTSDTLDKKTRRRPARLGAAGPSDLTALQNSREVHTLRLAIARNRSTPRVWLKRCQLATNPPYSPVPMP